MIETFIDKLRQIRSCRFINLTYRTKSSNELGKFTLTFGVDLQKVYRRDLKIMQSVRPRDVIEKTALKEIVSSLEESLEKGIGHNSQYTCENVYENLFRGCKLHKQTRELYIQGFVIHRKVIEQGVHKVARESAVVQAKRVLKQRMKLSKFRLFVIKNISRVALENEVLIIE